MNAKMKNKGGPRGSILPSGHGHLFQKHDAINFNFFSN